MSDWRTHDGRSDPPLPGNTEVEVQFLDGTTAIGVVHDWDHNWQWAEHGDHAGNIVSYRKRPKPFHSLSRNEDTSAVRPETKDDE